MLVHLSRSTLWSMTLSIALPIATIPFAITTPALAQITPDDSLGNERSVVNRNVQIRGRRGDRIVGGARRGTSLFHSFQEFNVNEGQRVYFANPVGVKSILGRITGSDVTDLMGTLGVEGSANLFLLNPNGIIFGPNVRLDITGSFLATTGDRFTFADGSEFSTINPQTPPLTISAPTGVQYGSTPGAITVESTASATNTLDPGLKVGLEQTLALLGGDVQIDQTTLSAPGGRIELAAAQEGIVEFDTTDTLKLNVPAQTARNTVTLNQSILQVLADRGGDIVIHAGDLELNQAQLFAGIASGQGKSQNVGGDITLDAVSRVTLANQTLVSTSVSPENDLFPSIPGIEVPAAIGNGGDVNIHATTLNVTGGSQIVSSTFGQGDAGDIYINVRDRVSLRGGSSNTTSSIFSRVAPEAQGNGGNVQLTVGSLRLSEGAQISTSTQGRGNAGNITVDARDEIILTGRDRSVNGVNTGILSRANSGAVGNGGNIRLSAPVVLVSNGAQLSAETAGTGNAGNVTINAFDRVVFNSLNAEGLASAAFSSVESTGNGRAGNIRITTDSLSIQAGSSLYSRSLADSAAGDVIIQADRLHLDQGQINATTTSGRGGNINLTIGDWIRLENDSRITARTQTGQGGDITINANYEPVDSIELDRSLITARSRDSGNAGNLIFNARQLAAQDSNIIASTRSGVGGDVVLQGLETLQAHGSRIAAATETGRAGSLRVNADRSIELGDRSRLSVAASGSRGQAGNLTINADQLTIDENSAATVSSRAGTAGNLTVNANQIFLDQGRLTAETAANRSGESTANLNFNDLDLLISQNHSLISAQASQKAKGGNVTIDAANGFVVASVNQNNDIVASADRGQGGAVEITTQGIFGLQEGRAEPGNFTNDIDVTSNFGLRGSVIINQPDIDPSQGLIELPSNILRIPVAQVCPDRSNSGATSEFFVTGRGGLPTNPTAALSSETLLSDWVTLEPKAVVAQQSPIPPPDPPLIEAQGWQIGTEGEVIFVAQVPSSSSSVTVLPEPQNHPSACP